MINPLMFYRSQSADADVQHQLCRWCQVATPRQQNPHPGSKSASDSNILSTPSTGTEMSRLDSTTVMPADLARRAIVAPIDPSAITPRDLSASGATYRGFHSRRSCSCRDRRESQCYPGHHEISDDLAEDASGVRYGPMPNLVADRITRVYAGTRALKPSQPLCFMEHQESGTLSASASSTCSFRSSGVTAAIVGTVE